MRFSIVALAALCCCVAVSLAADGTLYGLSAQTQSGIQLIKINPTTGKVAPDSVPLPFELEAQNLATVDIERGLFYTILYNDSTQAINLIGFNTSGAIVANVLLPFISSAFVGVGEAVDVDPTNGEVFCMGLMDDQKHHLYRVNPRTGKLRYLAECGYINVLGGAHAFAPSTNEVWLQYGVNKSGDITIDFFAFDAVSGRATKHVPMDSINFMSTLSFDSHANQFVGFGVNIGSNPPIRNVMRLDPATSKFSVLANLTAWYIDNGGIAAINNNDQILYGQLQANGGNSSAPFNLLSVDLKTGNVTASPPLCDEPALCPWSMEFLPNKH